jgi:hypothetical protein
MRRIKPANVPGSILPPAIFGLGDVKHLLSEATSSKGVIIIRSGSPKYLLVGRYTR